MPSKSRPQRDSDNKITAEPDNPDYQARVASALAAACSNGDPIPVAHGGAPAVIPRYQKILFVILLIASLGMGVMLWQLRAARTQASARRPDLSSHSAPEVAPAEQATLIVANDADNSLIPQVHSLPLPADPGARARAVLGKLLDLYAAPDATHPVSGGAASVAQVFLLPVHGAKSSAGSKCSGGSRQPDRHLRRQPPLRPRNRDR